MKRVIPEDPTLYNKLVQQVSMRLQSSQDWYRGHRENWKADYEIWHKFPRRPLATPSDDDEFEIQMGYAFGLGEQTNAKIVQPLLQMGIPFHPYPTEYSDQKAADNYTDMARDYYSKPHVQSAKLLSKKEMVICGPRWEVYEWMNNKVPGKKWGQIPVEVADDKHPEAKIKQMVPGEVDTEITLQYGFGTRHPSVFNMNPEPDRTTIDTGMPTDVSWNVEVKGELAVEDMMREMIYDPATRQNVPRYDFSKLLAAQGERAQNRYADFAKTGSPAEDGYGVLIVPVADWAYDGKKWDNAGGDYKKTDAVANESFEDRDKVWVSQMRTINGIITVAQGRFIIERIVDPWHRPRLGINIENYTTDPRCLYGPGLFRTIYAELKALDISKSLELQNFFRSVNGLIVVQPEKVITLDDFDSRSGGLVRASPEVEDVRTIAAPMPRQSAHQEAIATESALKNDIAFVASTMDGNTGPTGNAEQRKAPRKLMEQIENIIGTRFGVMAAQGMISECVLGENMLYMIEQFQWDKVSYSRIKDDGTTVFKKFDRTDIDTQGRGLKLLISVDPTFGNTSQQRQDSVGLLDRFISYEELRLKLKDPTMKKANISKQFENVLKNFGMRDLAGLFVLPTGEIDPDQELETLAGGGVVKCQGDLQNHITHHLLQLQSPGLQAAIQSGKANKDTAKNLQLLIQEDMARLASFLKNPQGAAQEKLSAAGLKHPGFGGGQ